MSRRAAGAAIVILCALSACGGTEASPELPPLDMGTGTTRAPAADDPALESTGDDPVTVLDHGTEPRRELRLTPEVGAIQRVTVRTDMRQSLGGGFDVTLPIFEVDFARTVTANGGGRITVEQSPYAYRVVDERGADPLVTSEMQRAFDVMIDLGASVVVLSERGLVIDETMMGEAAMYEVGGLGAGADPASLSLPLPADPIGVGARWQVELEQVNAGVRMQSVFILELVELHADRAVAHVRQTTTLPRSFIEGSQDRDEVMGGTMSATGTITWQFGHALALVEQNAEASMRVRSFRGRDAAQATIDQWIVTSTVARD